MSLYPLVDAIQEKRINYSNIDIMFSKKVSMKQFRLYKTLKNIGFAN
jgi:hypothetical protein